MEEHFILKCFSYGVIWLDDVCVCVGGGGGVWLAPE